jgi:tetratricopeptide (TPR) repeat protein
MAARLGRKLDEALAHAQRATALAPDKAAYLDTLAEVHFRRGEPQKAVELARRCIELEPEREFYREQLERFEKGEPSTASPPR